MYETQTFETIMDRCLSRVSSSVDKREGSVIYDALAPACAELATLYTELSNILDRAFPDTATGEDLDRKCMERGVIRRQASAAVRKGVFTSSSGAAFSVPIGTRFSGGEINYIITGALNTPGAYSLTSETPGEIGNGFYGTLLPIDFVDGLAGT